MATAREWNERKRREDEERKQQKLREEQARQEQQIQQKTQERQQAYQQTQEPTNWAARGLRPASEQNARRTQPFTVRLDGMDDAKAVRVMSVIPDKKEKEAFVDAYRAFSGTRTTKTAFKEEISRQSDLEKQREEAKIAYNEQRMQEAQAERERGELMGTLSGGLMMDFNGAIIDPNTADTATVERGIRSIADENERKKAATAYLQLTKTRGSRFYGQKPDESKLKTYLESANLAQGDYNAVVDGMRASFYGDGAHDEEDAQSYLEQRALIEENEAYSPYVRAQYLDALNRIYTEITGKKEKPETSSVTAGAVPTFGVKPPLSSATGGEETSRSPKGKAGERSDAEGEKKPGFWEGLTYQRPETTEAPAHAVQGPVQQASEEEAARPSLNELLAAGAPMPPAQEEQAPKVTVQTPGEAMDYMLRGQYDQIEGPGVEALNQLLESSPLARRVTGMLTEEDQRRVTLGNDPAETIAFENIASNGQTVREVYAMVMSDSYPADLRGDALAQMAIWAARAEEMEREGTLGGYDPELPSEDQLPLMERLLTTDETSMAELAALRQAREDIDADMAAMRAKTQERSEQSLKDARAAALRGEVSEEQRALLAESAKDVGYAELQEIGSWEQLRARLGEVDEYMFSGAFAQSGVKLALDAQGIVDSADYEAALNDQMAVILNEDATIAYSLGMTLEDYYAKTGGMDINRLCELAASRISQEGASITPEEEALLSETPEGEGVGMGYALGAGAVTGFKQYYTDFQDSLYEFISMGMVERTAARMQSKYQSEYGAAWGRTKYAQDLMAAAQSGVWDKAYSDAILRALAEAPDVYMIGVDPGDVEDAHLKSVAQVRRDTETMQDYIAQHATRGEATWFGFMRGVTYNATSAGVATTVGAVTGSGSLGFVTGYSVPGFKNNFDYYLGKGYSRDSAKGLALMNTGTDYFVNVGTFSKIYGQATGAGALTQKGFAQLAGSPGKTGKAIAAIKAFSKAFAQNEFEEVVSDEFGETLGRNWIENSVGKLLAKSDAGEEITGADFLDMAVAMVSPGYWGVGDAAREVIANAPENAMGAIVFSLTGAAREGMDAYKSVQAAQAVASGKKTSPQDVQTVVEETKNDLQAPAFREAFTEAAYQAQEDQAVATELIYGEDKNGSAAAAAKATRQAEEARAKQQEGEQTAQAASAQFDEAAQAVANGDLTRVPEMKDAGARLETARKQASEYAAIAERREEEAEVAKGKRLEEARSAARRNVRTMRDAATEAAQEQRGARIALADEQLAGIAREQEQLDAEFEEAVRAWSDAEEMGLDADTLGALEARMDEIGARQVQLEDAREALQNPQVQEVEAEAPQTSGNQQETQQAAGPQETPRSPQATAARREAEALLGAQEDEAVREMQEQATRDAAREEMNALTSALSSVVGRNATKIYLNDKQVYEVLSATGMSTISQVNNAYGTRFRVNRAKADVELDGNFFTELAGQLPGYADVQSAHPETELMRLLNRRQDLRFQLRGYEASVGAADAESYLPEAISRGNLDPVTQKLASSLKKHTGLELIVMPLADDVRGMYDRASGRLFLSNHLGAGERMRQVVMHELTHFIEQTPGYAAYEQAALEAAYHGDEDAMERDAEELRERYAESGIELARGEVSRELTAAATEKLMDAVGAWGRTGSEQLVYDLMGEKLSFPVRVYLKLSQFLARRRAKKQGGEAMKAYEALERAKDNLKAAIAQAGAWQEGKGGQDVTVELESERRADGKMRTESEQTQMAIERDAQGKPFVVVEEDILEGVPEGEWAKKAKQVLKEKFPNGVTIGNNVIQINSKSRGELTNSKDSRRIGREDPERYADKLRSFSNMDEVLRTSHDYINEEPSHARTDSFEDFARGSVRMEIGGKAYEADVLIGSRKDGELVLYDLLDMHKTDIKKRAPRLAPIARQSDNQRQGQLFSGDASTEQAAAVSDRRTVSPSGEDTSANSSAGQKSESQENISSLSDTSIQQAATGVNTHSTQDGPKYAVGLRQFGNKTAQKLDILSDQVKAILKGSEYEKVTNREQVERANQAVDSRGLDTVADELVSRGDWTAEDNVLAAVAIARAESEGRSTEAAMLAMAYNAQGTKQGQALQARQVIKRLSPTGAMAEAVRRAEDDNRKKGIRPGDIPVGSGKPAKKRRKTEGGKTLTPDGEFDPNNPMNKGKTSTLPDVEHARGADGEGAQTTFLEPPKLLDEIYDTADRTKADLDELLRDNLAQDVNDRNPWRLPLNAAQMALIEKYKLKRTALPGNAYSHASLKERMLAAIVATPNGVRGDGLLTLCQQLEAMKRGLAVVTEADLNYISGQMSTYLYAEGEAGEGMPETWEGKLALQRAYNAQANVSQASGLEKLNALGYDNMLSSPKTWVKNVGSNVLIRPLELASEGIGGLFERTFVTPKTGNRTTGLPIKELGEGNRRWASELAQTAVDYAINHADTGHSSSFDLNHNGRTFNSKLLDCYDALVSFAMQAGDRTFWEQCCAEELGTVKRLKMKKTETVTEDGREVARLVDMTEEDMQQEAAMRATERVFQEDRGIIEAINGAKNKSPALGLVLTGIFPFTKTPFNVAARMMQYSPAGFIWAAVKYGLWDGKRNGGVNFDQRKFVMNLSRGTTGTFVMLAGMGMRSIGLLVSGREDEEDVRLRELRKAKGESYGMYWRIGDKQIPVDFALPAAGPLVIGAEIANALEESEGGLDLAGKVLSAATASQLDQLFENSMLSGVTDLFRGYSDPLGIMTNIGVSTAENYASRLTPAVIRAIAKATDPYVRDTNSQSFIQQVFNETIVQYWPILRQTLPIKTDLTGDKTLQSGAYSWGKESQNAAMHMLESFAAPWTAGSEKQDAALDELLDLSYRTGESSFLPGALLRDNQYDLTIGKTLARKLRIGRVGLGEYTSVTLELTDEEKRWANGAYADTLFNGSNSTRGLREQMDSPRWGRMSDEDKIKAVTEARDAAKEATIRELVRRRKAEGRML